MHAQCIQVSTSQVCVDVDCGQLTIERFISQVSRYSDSPSPVRDQNDYDTAGLTLASHFRVWPLSHVCAVLCIFFYTTIFKTFLLLHALSGNATLRFVFLVCLLQCSLGLYTFVHAHNAVSVHVLE